MGRSAKPVVLQLLEGNKGKYSKAQLQERLEREKLIQPKTDKLKPPSWLSSFAKKEFKRMVNELKEVDLVTNVDVNALALYCDAYGNYVECTKVIQEEGLMVEYTNKAAETNKVPHPLLTKQKALFEQMKSLSTEFGLTPAARAKIAIPKLNEKEESDEEKMFGDV
ncbi:phage terminase small subunit P27 family [Bacillus sp. RG28]|uniref:Phage terminase small subunit P27 family n=1 Tax=Gottfriedia endophytica TaxID=2820819 RepID=A0A940NJH3_9BACI|nr:phage terminase small subunit P27 family [Gottfriedia endophytica]MBP0725545.1 phage terminase small subunit P27 family [Gottfriedia endophytica]